MEEKLCQRCKVVLPNSSFKIRIYPSGTQTLASYCIKCDLEYHAERKQISKEKKRESLKSLPIPDNEISKKKVIKKVCIPEQISQPIVDEKTRKRREDALRRYYENRDENIKRNKEYKAANQEKVKETRKKYLEKNRDKIREQRSAYHKEYSKKNRLRLREYLKNYRQKNPGYRLRDNMSTRLMDYIYKQKHTVDYLGSSIKVVMQWLQSNFETGMTWQNYGQIWEIDHTIPCSLFNCKNDVDIFVCFNWKNLYPMFSKSNRQKNCRFEEDTITNRFDLVHDFCKKHGLNDEYDEYSKLYNEYISKFKSMSSNTSKMREHP